MKGLFTIFSLILFFSVTMTKMTNRQAQQCFQKAVNSQICSKPLSVCYENKQCEKQINTFPCDFMHNDNLFNGYCFNQWYQNSVLSKDLITCLVNECNLRFNSKHNMTQFFECNSNVVQAMSDMICDQECFNDLKIVMKCMQSNPVEYCYNQQINNKDANKIVTAIRQSCIDKTNNQQKQINDQL